jgi:hypothetical protein
MEKQDGTRRDVLKSIGAAGAAGLSMTGTASALSEADAVYQVGDVRTDTGATRTVRIEPRGRVDYSFAVTGVVAPADGPAAAVADGEVSARTAGESHSFEFSGEFTAFTLDGDADVFVDGDRFDVAGFPHNSLEIVPDGRVSYDVSASGAVVVDKGRADQPNARTAAGDTTDRHVLSYTGELTYVDIDGDATIRRNGSQVGVDELLPSTMGNEFTAATRVSGAYTIETSQGVETADGQTVEMGEPARFSGQTAGRYGGRVEAVEHPSGARVEFDYLHNEVTYRASETATEFALRTERGVIVDGDAYDEARVSVSAGETATVTPFGSATKIVIDDLTVQFKPDAHPEAEQSGRLQAAARLERTAEYDRMAGVAAGRVRHDAAGLAARQLRHDDKGDTTAVEYRLANPDRGDRGVMTIRETDTGVETANIRYEYLEDGRAVSVDGVSLDDDGGLTRDGAEVSDSYTPPTNDGTVDTLETDPHAEVFANSFEPKTRAEVDLGEYEDQFTDEQLSDQGFLGFFYDVKSWVESLSIDDVYDTILWFWNVIKSRASSVGMTAAGLALESPFLLVDLAMELEDSVDISDKGMMIYNLNVSGAFYLLDLADAGFFDALLGNNWGCAGCIVVALVVKEGIVYGATAGCLYFLNVAALACNYFLPIILDFVFVYTPFNDIRNTMCGGGLINEIDYC